jgi:hypothetical protein
MSRSLPEATRVLRSGGRLRLAMHATEGTVVRDTKRSLADADYLLDNAQLIPLAILSLTSLVAWEKGEGLKEKAQSDHAQFRDALEAVELYERQAMDRHMLASVRRDLIDAFNTHRQRELKDQIAEIRELASQVQDHRERQRALVNAAVTRKQAEEFAAELAKRSFADVSVSEQRRDGELLAHVLEGTAP